MKFLGRKYTYVFASPNIEFQLIFLTKLLSLTELADRIGIVVNLQRIAITIATGKQKMLQGIHTGLVSVKDTATAMNAIKVIQKIPP